ncbi:hypothetical protein PAHAL_5G508900 [Panicum hallii]|uniref:BHLH domain-containing protein n=1 Tax=Panicum hallii TaxID=206008 RepID=A0A2S3HYL5_9POAL|nr:putative transcription factor bHLH041 [Panicum hallii]PAN32744.1 hypothetical protein PAHAL_5G508900 [Panicum hallii]
MDSSSWLHGYIGNAGGGNNGFMCGYAVGSCTPAELQYREEEQQQFLISAQIQHHLNQISMRMNMDDEASAYDVPSNDGGGGVSPPVGVHNTIGVDGGLLDPRHAGSFPSSSSSSSLSLPSASLSCSPESSAHVLAAPGAAATTACSQYLEVSSQVPLPPAVPYDHQQYANLHVPAPAAAMVPEPPATNTGAFKRYARHLGPKRPPKPGACGQRMFKTAMSVLSKMHAAARYSAQQQYYYQQAASAEAAAPPPSVNQLQHMFSERKRREKLNDSFHALKAVLPPGAKKDKTSILIRAREYVRSLESKVSELEEKNRLLETRLVRGDDSSDDGASKDAAAGNDHDSGAKVQVEITRAANEERPAVAEPRDLCTLKIAVSSPCNMTDVAVRTLQCLKEQIGDGVSLVAMSTSGSAEPSEAKNTTSARADLTLQIKSPPGWEEQPVKDAVAKVVADALTLPPAAPR